ncbi:MAG: TonB-dependent receptor family protein, partial [Gelidibacter sp.]|nr:TonB-dependent receptor family protein [Gelidibacter sp.]
SFLYKDGNQTNNTKNTIKELDSDGNLLSQSLRFDPENESDKTIQYAVNFDKQFTKPGHKLTFDFQYEDNTDDEKSTISQDGNDAEKVRTLENQDRILLQSDYVLPIGEDSQFEFGYKGNFNLLDTDYTFQENIDGQFVRNNDLSNNLNYKEQINAIYSQFGSKIKAKLSYLFGLRMESTRITIDQATSGDFDKKQYLGLFPTVNLGYELSEKQSLSLGYNRRISRPRSRFINPFPSRSSATNLFQGNPDLEPSYSNKVDFGYLNRFGKVTLNSSIYYEHATDVFTFISEDTGEVTVINGTPINVIKRTPINLATNDRYGFEFTLTYRPIKKWNLNGNFNLFHSKTEGFYNNVDYGASNLSWFARINNKLTLPGNIDWQTRMFYGGPSKDAQNKRKGIFSTDLAFSKDVFKDQASIAFNVSDVFNSRKRIIESYTSTFNSNAKFQWRERSFNLSFTYRFNQQKKQQDRDRGQNGGDDMEYEG